MVKKIILGQKIKITSHGKNIVNNNINNSKDFSVILADNSKVEINQTNSEQKKLTEAAADIQQLLEQLEKSYPTYTNEEKEKLATEAIAQIENNPNLTARILRALKVGGIKAFEEFLSHPAASFVISALEDWQKTKAN